MNKKKIQKNKAFVILFAVMLSSIILALALGVSNIALKEINFSTSAKDANDAFFAADTGAECALFYDKGLSVTDPFPTKISCGSSVDIDSSRGTFAISGLGSAGKSCAKVTVDKGFTTEGLTTITSKGYSSVDPNSGNTSCIPGPKAVERELEVTY